MSTTDPTEREYANHELLRMDEQTARNTLTVNQFERWEKLTDLHAEAEETKEKWAEEDERVAEITVAADMEDLGTEVDVYGNELLVHVDPENDQFQAAAEDLDDLRGEYDDAEVEELPDDTADRMASLLQDMLDAVIVRWDGAEWADLGDGARLSILERAREKWGLDGLMMAWILIAEAVNEEREEKLEVVDSFRGAQRRGRR